MMFGCLLLRQLFWAALPVTGFSFIPQATHRRKDLGIPRGMTQEATE